MHFVSIAMADSSVSVGVDIKNLLQKVVKNEKLKNAKIKMQAGSEAGDGYLAINSAVEIISDDGELKLFVKAAPVRTKSTEYDFMRDVFLNEIFFYKNVYPEYVKFQTEKGMEIHYPRVPKFYEASTENLREAIAMENLKEQGYVIFDRRNIMNDEHITFVFKHFARFHAVSFAFKDQKNEMFEKLATPINITMQNMMDSGMEKIFIKFCDDINDMFADDEFIASNIGILKETLMDVMTYPKNMDKYSIITQGDCWCNNMMFKYADAMNTTCPSDMKLIDWQILKVNYPVFDMAYFFYTISSKEIMAKHDHYLKIYHDELSKNIKELGSDPDELYPYSVLLEHWKLYSKYGLLMAFLIIRVMLTEKDQVADLSKSVEDGGEIGDAFDYKLKDEVVYKQRIRDVLEHFILNKYL